MSTIEEHINSINAKLQLLLKNYATLKKDNNHLNEEIKKLKESEKGFLEKVNTLEMQTSILKASAGKMSGEEKTDFEKRIKAYIKDIDKCMAMLNN